MKKIPGEHCIAQREGNTSLRARRWCFTLNNYNLNEVHILERINSMCTKFAMQEEVGEGGTPHIQGFWVFSNARRFSALKKWLPRLHLERMRGTTKDNMAYCTKKETRTGRQWTSWEVLRDPMEGLVKTEWEELIDNILDVEPDPRRIYWFWEEVGCVGKTTYAKHLCMTRNALYLSGKVSDMKFAISTLMPDVPKIFIFDFCRSREEYVSYEGIEAIKNGIFFSGKYEGKMVMYNIPHVICFANFCPRLNALSIDRWSVIRIGEEREKDRISDLLFTSL